MALTPISSSPPWSDLPRDLLSKIAKTLDTRIDTLRFRSVCSSWRSIISSSSKTSQYSIKLPFPIFPDYCLNPNHRGHFLVTESIIYALQPLIDITESDPKIWVVKTQESSTPGKVILKNPLSELSSKDMASTYLPKELNLLDYKVVEISKVHELEFIDETEISIDPFDSEMRSVTSSIKQVAINSSSLEKVDDNFVITALHRMGKVALWRMGDAEWINIHANCELFPNDNVVFHDGRFFVAYGNGITIIVDPVSVQTLSFGTEWPDQEDIGGHYVETTFPGRHSVKSLGDLFSVVLKVRCYDDDYEILMIYKFNEEKCNWVEVDGLNDQAFVTTDYNSFSLASTDFPGFKGNCVYFANSYPTEIGLCDLNNFDFHFNSVLYYNDHSSRNMFWPPPAWLK